MDKTENNGVYWMSNANLKSLVSDTVRKSVGREFHDAGPEKEKARSPNLVRSRGMM